LRYQRKQRGLRMTRKLFEGTFDHASSHWHSLLVFFVTTVSRRGRTTYAKGRIIRASMMGTVIFLEEIFHHTMSPNENNLSGIPPLMTKTLSSPPSIRIHCLLPPSSNRAYRSLTHSPSLHSISTSTLSPSSAPPSWVTLLES